MRVSLLLLFSLAYHGILCQSWEKITTVKFSSTISSISSDPRGQLFIGTKNGECITLDSLGNQGKTFFLANQVNIDNIISWNPLRIFFFSADNQKFWFLERFSAEPRVYNTNELSDDFIFQMVPGQDHSFWIIDSRGLELKKINEVTRKELLSINLLNQNISFPKLIKSYSNYLIILDEDDQICIIDQFGSVIKRFSIKNISYFQMWKDNLMYLTEKKLHTTSLYKKIPDTYMEIPGQFKKFQRISDSLYYFIEGNSAHLYQLH